MSGPEPRWARPPAVKPAARAPAAVRPGVPGGPPLAPAKAPAVPPTARAKPPVPAALGAAVAAAAVAPAVLRGVPPPPPAPPMAGARPRSTASPSMLEAAPGDHLVLMPGQLHFGRHAASLRTLLGSCVAITLWHPVRRLGGMCHFLLPSRTRAPGATPDGRFGDEAVELMVGALTRMGTRPEEYVAHLYGGADTMPDTAKTKLNIGERNIEQGWSLIDRYGFQLDGVDVGDNVPRTVLLDCSSGEVQIKRSTRI